jgi:hypothetical protein
VIDETKFSDFTWWQKIISVGLCVGVPLVLIFAVVLVIVIAVKVTWSLL